MVFKDNNKLNKNKNKNKGVSLIVLIVTIIVMLILATTFVLTMQQQNIPTNLEEYSARNVINSIQEKYNITYGKALNLVDGREDKLTDEYFKDVVPEKYSAELEAKAIGLAYIGKNANIKEIAKDMGLLTDLTIAESNPNIQEIILTSEIDKITILVKLKENIENVDKYTYNIRKLGESNWTSTDESENFTYTKTGLLGNTEYEVQVDILDKIGNTSSSEIYKIKTASLETPTFDNASTDWTNQSVSIKINYPTTPNIEKEWSYTGTEYDWNKVTGTEYNALVDKNKTVYARIKSGLNYSSIVTKEVQNIDKLVPNDFTPTIPIKTTNSVTVNGLTTDKNSTLEYGKSGIKGYMFSKDSGKTWTEEQSVPEYTFENAVDQANMRIKVKAIDYAGNETISEEISTLTVDLPSPVINSTPTGWTNGIVTVNITYANKVGTTRQYSLDGNIWTNVSALSESLNISDNNKIVYARLIDGNNQTSNITTLAILNIDKNPPEKFTPIFISKTTNSINVRGATVDKATPISGISGLKGYEFRVDDGAWSQIQTSSVYNLENLKQNTTYKVQIKAIDNIGNERISEDLMVTTLEIPNGNTSIVMTQDKTTWTNTDVLVTAIFPEKSNWPYLKLMVSRDNVNWSEYTNPIPVQNNNEYVYAKLVDNTNQSGIVYAKQITNIDKILPTSNISPNGGDYTIPTSGTVATLKANLSANDIGGSGLNIVQYAWGSLNSNTEPTSGWTNYTASGTSIQKTDAVIGTYYLWTKITDIAGNTSTVIKKSNPYIIRSSEDTMNKIILTPSTTAWTNGNVNVSINYGAGITQNRKYGIGSANTNATVNPSTQIVAVNGVVYAEATDIAGNKITATLQITNIDKTLPVAGTMTMKLGSAAGANYTDNTWTNQSIYLAPVNGSDDESGHSSTTYQVSGANTVVAGTVAAQTITNAGTSTITLTTTDIAGNSATRTYTVKIDKTLPTISFGTNGGANIKTASTTATVSDTGGSGISATQQYIWTTSPSAVAPTSGWTNYTNGATLTQSGVTGTYYLWVKGIDLAGNVTNIKSNSFDIDNTAPNIPTISISPILWTNGNVTVTITYSGDSSIKEYSTNGSTWSAYSSPIAISTNGTTVYARGTDLAGNVSLVATNVISNIDKIAPTISFGTNGGSNIKTASTTATVSDSGGSGVNTTQYVWSTSTTTPTSGWTNYTNGTTLTQSGVTGTYYLWIKGIDRAGNTTNTMSNAFNIDNTAPTTWTNTAN